MKNFLAFFALILSITNQSCHCSAVAPEFHTGLGASDGMGSTTPFMNLRQDKSLVEFPRPDIPPTLSQRYNKRALYLHVIAMGFMSINYILHFVTFFTKSGDLIKFLISSGLFCLGMGAMCLGMYYGHCRR